MVNRIALKPADAVAEEDVGLVDAARAGDPDAREALARRHLQDVFRTALRVLGDGDLAADAAQDAMVNALNGLDRFRGDASFRTWVLRITVNSARSLARRRNRRREVPLTVVDAHAADEPDASSQVAVRAEADRARGLLEQLPTKQRLAVGLRIDGLSFREVGQAIGCSEGAARVNYHLGIKRLRERMK